MFKKFFSYYTPYKSLFIKDLICAFFVAAANLFYPMITRNFIGKYVPNRQLNMIIFSAALLLIIFIAKYFFQHYIQYWGHVMGVNIQGDIRAKAFSHLQQMPFSYYDKARSGGIMSRIITDTENIAEFAHHGPEELIIAALTLIGAFILLLTVNIPLTLIIFALIPCLLFVTISSRKKLSKATMETRKNIGEVNAVLENSISGVRVTKAYGSYDTEANKFNKMNDTFINSSKYRYKKMADFFAGNMLMLDLLTVFTFFIAGLFAYNGAITIADFTTYLLFINVFSDPLKAIVQLIEMFQSGIIGFKRVNDILDLPVEEDTEGATVLEKVKGDIDFNNISFKYQSGTERLFTDLSLHIDAGETFALVGPSGGGKSTICHILPRFYEIESGEIDLDGVNINHYTRLSLRDKIGIVQQDTFLFTGTIKDNIAYGSPDATDEEIITAAKAANIHEYIMSLPEGYDTFVGERGVMLSGGQKQRISIARVFLKNPPILILDEATSALDNATEVAIQSSLNELSEGRTTLVVAHRLSTIRHADKIAFIAGNKVQEIGTHDELLSQNGLYAKLWKAQLDANPSE